MSITFSSCFYIIKSKFEPDIYVEWMNNFISIVNNFNLIIYTDENSRKYIDTKENNKIKIIIKPIEQFYNYKYKTDWIENHQKNLLLNDKLCNWANNNKIINLDKNKIIYACINNNNFYIDELTNIINEKDENKLPTIPIPHNQQSIAGGFFILHKDEINWWFQTFDTKLSLYFEKNVLVKDDQIILADCIFSNLDKFVLLSEKTFPYDNWFMFQRILN